MRRLSQLVSDGLLMFIANMPGPVGQKLRYRYWQRRFRHLGANVRIDPGVYFQGADHISIDDLCWIDRGVMILAGPDLSTRRRRRVPGNCSCTVGEVSIGRQVHIGPYSIISGIGGASIGNDCTLAANVKIYSFSHHYCSDDAPGDRSFAFGSQVNHERQFLIEGPVVLESNVGIALNAVILPGVTIGRDSFVTINSVVTSSFPENSLIGGNPARFKGQRFRDPHSDSSHS